MTFNQLKQPIRRDQFKAWCLRNGINRNDYKEQFSGEYYSSGKSERKKLFNYIPLEVTNDKEQN